MNTHTHTQVMKFREIPWATENHELYHAH